MKQELDAEAERIRTEYERRERELTPDFYALHRPANLFLRHGQERALVAALRRAGMLPLAERRILEIGCGRGQWLVTFEELDARRENLAGIELDWERAQFCAARFTGADIRQGNAAEVPWPDATFDIVFQSTVFTSILQPEMKAAVAREMLRVAKPDGRIVWYDFMFDNPKNSAVRAIKRAELSQLFPNCRIDARRVTLAPPLARRIVPISWLAAEMLESLRVLNTHLMCVIQRAS